MELKQQNSPFIWGFLVLSLLLHLLAIRLLPGIDMTPINEPEKPVYVEIRQSEPVRERPMELDVEPDKSLDVPRDRPAKRVGPVNQVVAVETAPKGDAEIETRPDAAAPKAAEHETAHTGAIQSKSQIKPSSSTDSTTGSPTISVTNKESSIPTTISIPNIDPKALLQITDSTSTAILDKKWQRKKRDDMFEGEYLRFDLEHEVYSSFFYRFRDKFNLVWNEPTLNYIPAPTVVGITVNRNGYVQDVKLLESSGNPSLDNLTIAAIRRGSPYGDIPKHHKKETFSFARAFKYYFE